nr:hypothetical protein [Tanacetum cinerariifolium]
MRVLLLELVFTFPCKLKSSLRIPSHFDDRNVVLLQTFDLTIHDFDSFLDEVKLVVDLDFLQRHNEGFFVDDKRCSYPDEYLRLSGVTARNEREHERMILESVEHGPPIWPTIEENDVIRIKKYGELSTAKKIQADYDMKAKNIIIQGIPADIY